MALHLAPHTISDYVQPRTNNVRFNSRDSTSFTTATETGFCVYQTAPLLLLSRRDALPGSVDLVVQLERSNILFVVGGGSTPLYPPNKVIVWDDKLAKPVAQLEFRERVRGIAARRDRLAVALSSRVIVFALGKGANGIWREGSYETTSNPKGIACLVVIATEKGATLLAFPGRQPGQIQLVKLPPFDPLRTPLPPPPSYDPTKTTFPTVNIIVAHTTNLSALAITPNGDLLATTSNKGTLVRVWDTGTGSLVKELRRGTDYAEIFGLSLRRDGKAVAVSSDKGTVHAWDLTTSRQEKRKADQEAYESSRQRQLDLLKPYLPKYFSSEWSHSQFRLPAPAPSPSKLPNFASLSPTDLGKSSASASSVEDDVCMCEWIKIDRPLDSSRRPDSDGDEFQIIAVTRSGGWFRIKLDGSDTNKVAGLSKKATRECTLEEYRRFGGDEWEW
ncbi:Phosphatidylinositol 3,5-bisphosphate-binding protein [Microbotryomycetes sp. JL201]|nr:Phosphatidylinositol 3,5-bisphosphate-binding protein [Microbotryomycetes sp. JL201]